MKRLLFFLFLCTGLNTIAQEEQYIGEKILRLNLITPSMEYETPLYKNIYASASAGVILGGSYPELSTAGTGFIYMVSDYTEIELKHLYGLKKRIRKGKNVSGNSSNYWGFRFLTRGKALSGNIDRTTERDYMVSLVWGLQRQYKPVHLLFNIGPKYYWDGIGNWGIFPISVQLNLGFNVWKF